MNKIIRWYNQNRQTFWITILVVIGAIGLIQTLNNYYKNNTKEESSSSTNISTTTYNNQNYSVVTETEISKTVSENSQTIIKNFFNCCNNGRIEEAYNLLSDDCKEELYPTISDFTDRYYKRIFTEKRDYDSTLWITTSSKNTYRVEIMSDLLATGQKEVNPIEEYYTVVVENGKYKINTNGYIGKEELNISKSQNNVNITILSRIEYMEYEEYEIRVENKTGEKLLFNTKQNVNSIYIQDENGIKYIAFLNELVNSELLVLNGDNKTLNIRFNRGYKPSIKIQEIVFEDIKINNKNENERIEIQL